MTDSTSGGEQEIREVRFEVGDALPADDPLARFILVVSMGLNDNSLANTTFVETEEPYKLVYFFQLASGHLYELAKTLRRAYEEWREVKEFIDALPQEYQDDFDAIVSLADEKNETGRRLRHLRNGFFHYPSGSSNSASQVAQWIRILATMIDSELN